MGTYKQNTLQLEQIQSHKMYCVCIPIHSYLLIHQESTGGEKKNPKYPVMCTGKGIMTLLIRFLVSGLKKKKKTCTAGHGGTCL